MIPFKKMAIDWAIKWVAVVGIVVLLIILIK